jgi:hypothetical protein
VKPSTLRQRQRLGPICDLVLVLCALLFSLGACSEEEIDYTHRAGEQCEECDYGGHLEGGEDDCSSCIYLSYDPETLTLLKCQDNLWTALGECPGGVDVQCHGTGSYAVTCLDSDGNDIRWAVMNGD